MTTMIAPEMPAPSTEAIRFVAIRANLLPDEITDARRARRMARMVAVGLVALLVLLAAGYAVTMWQTTGAKDSLATVQRKSAALQSQQHKFGPLVTAQSQAASIKAELTKLMAGDLQWRDLLAVLRKGAGGGVRITSVTGTTTFGGGGVPADTGGTAIFNQTGKQQVGTLTIAGTAPDKNAVAAYIDTLTKIPGLTAAFPASVTGLSGKVIFAASVIITSDALGGRYSATSTGGH